MPFHLELGSGGQKFPEGKAMVVNTRTGKHYSNSPIPIENAKRQMRILEAYKTFKETAREVGADKRKLREEVDSGY